MSRARTPMPSIGLVGVGGGNTKFGKLYPTQADSGALVQGQIIPEVIACPWATDEVGVSIPAGTVAVRTLLTNSMANEYALPLTDDDSWILVPGTLPAGWTKRGRDSQRGAPVYDFSVGGYNYRGCPAAVTAYSSDPTFPHQVFGSVSSDTISMGPISAGKTHPQRRDQGGLTDVTVFPMNVSRKTLQTDFRGTGGFSGDYRYYGLAAYPFAPNTAYQGNGCWLPQNFGYRNLRLRMGLFTNNSSAPNAATPAYYRISHNADGSILGGGPLGLGDTIDTIGSVTPSWTADGFDVPAGLWRWYYDIDLGAFGGAMPNPQFRGYLISWTVYYDFSTPSLNIAGSGRPYLWASPRLDIPLWFTVTGRNLVAPGGYPT